MNSRLADYLARLGERLEVGKDADTEQVKEFSFASRSPPIRFEPKQTLPMESLFLCEHAHKTGQKSPKLGF
ncbi:hypothetical protein RND71_042281 [Anisodus tanguticus]|uniref:Uncharacterized protein n=1 Tax=Anisodus tanguticus TaxID=243964 RepID=A0AAE1UUN2_9SOLA|nr:hypothetical protein RND71_042281 [Anisodus tanguticus]